MYRYICYYNNNKRTTTRQATGREESMKTLVKINAEGVYSRFGYIIDEVGDMALIKVSCKLDWFKCLETEHCIILGSTYFEKTTT